MSRDAHSRGTRYRGFVPTARWALGVVRIAGSSVTGPSDGACPKVVSGRRSCPSSGEEGPRRAKGTLRVSPDSTGRAQLLRANRARSA